MADLIKALLSGFRGALRLEQLPPPSPSGSPLQASPGLLGHVFAPEKLGVDPEPAAGSGPGMLSTIFAPETLGTEAPPPPRPRTHWLALLTRPEKLDD